MPAPTISWSASEAVQSPSTSQDTRTYSATIGASSKAVVVVVACVDGGSNVEFATVDGVSIPQVVNILDGTTRVVILVLDDLAGVTHPGSVVVEIVDGSGTYLIWVGVLDHGGDLIILDSGSDPGATPWAAALDSGGEAGLALAGMAKTGGQDISDGSGQTRLASNEFITLNDEAISSKPITGAGSMSFTASGGPGVMGAVLLGGVDTGLAMVTPIEYGWGVQTGITLDAPADVLLSPEAPIRYGWGVREGIRLVGSTGKRQVALIAGGIEGAEPTTGGTEGQLLTQHADRPPSWEDAASSGALGWFDITAYGATSGGAAAANTSAINAAIAALNAATRGVLYVPAGTYDVDAALTTITASGLILGDGGSASDPASRINQTSVSANLLTVSGDGLSFRGLYLQNTSAGATTSDGIAVTGGAWARYDDLTIASFRDCLSLTGDSKYWTIGRAYIEGLRYGVHIVNTTNPDAGDWEIGDDTVIGFGANNGVGIYMENSGGGKIIGNKINAGAKTGCIGIHLDISGTDASGSLIIVGNSIENVDTHGVLLETSGTATWSSCLIEGNQFGLWSSTAGKAITAIGASAGAIARLIIADNTLHAAAANTGPAIALTNVASGRVSGNLFSGFDSLLSTTTCTDLVDDSGAVAAGVLITGTPTSGQVPTAVSGTSATWQEPSVSAPTAAQVKAVGRWEPVQFDDGSSPWPFVYFNDEIVVAWITTP